MIAAVLWAAACAWGERDVDGGDPNVHSQSRPPTVNPEFSTYSCVEVEDYPWMAAYDIRRDGRFGVDDLRAYLYSDSPELERKSPIDRNQKSVDDTCLAAKMGMIGEEVEWKLRDMIARQGEYQTADAMLAEIDKLQDVALKKLYGLSRLVDRERIELDAWASVVEQCLRARNIVRGVGLDEPFAAGLNLVQRELNSGEWVLEVMAVHPQSDAASASVLEGDLITAVNGVSIFALSADGTVDGLDDPHTDLIRGFDGPWGSEMDLAITRGEIQLVLTVSRKIWSARALGVKESTAWNGTVSANRLR